MPDEDVNAETERQPPEEQHGADESTEAKGAKDDDNPALPDDVGQKGAGSETGALGGLDHGTEPDGEDARQHERP